MIVWGRHGRTVSLGPIGARYCQTCEKERPFSLVLRYTVFGFFWIFNWVTSKTYYLTCDVCSSGWALENREIEQALKNSMRHNPIPFMDRFGFITAVGVAVASIGILALIPPSQESIQAKLSYEQLKAKMEVDKSDLTQLETRISSLGKQIDLKQSAIAELASKITAIERQYPNHQIPAGVYDNYSRLIDEYNKLVSESNGMVAQHSNLIVSYNAKTKAYNEELQQLKDLKDKCGSSCN
jgi:hypothetical protein